MRAFFSGAVSCSNITGDFPLSAVASASRTEYSDNNASVSDMLVDVVLDVQFDLHETLKKDSDFTR